MNTLRVDILNPKATQLLQGLADLKLISIREEKEDEFLRVINKIRAKAKKSSPSLEEITKEVEIVRLERYAASHRKAHN